MNNQSESTLSTAQSFETASLSSKNSNSSNSRRRNGPKKVPETKPKLNVNAQSFQPSLQVLAQTAHVPVPHSQSQPGPHPAAKPVKPHSKQARLQKSTATPACDPAVASNQPHLEKPAQSQKSSSLRSKKPTAAPASNSAVASNQPPPETQVQPQKNSSAKPTKGTVTSLRPSSLASAKVAPRPRNFSCPICLQESDSGKKKGSELNPINYFAIGACDHMVCSLCALRMRCKSKDLSCPMCKASLPFMCILSVNEVNPRTNKPVESFNETLGMVTYPWPQDLSRVDLYDVRSIGCMPDVHSKLLYINCDKFHLHMENLKSIHCPIKNCPMHGTQIAATAATDAAAELRTGVYNGTSRFRSHAELLSHLEKKHNGMTMCKLCLENRPLFVSEHEVFQNGHKFKQHLHGYNNLANGCGSLCGGTGANVYMLGHPQCKFCDTSFFDSNSLYKHMQQQHHTCTLCDRQMMFRYYRNLQALREHHNVMHYACSLCHRDPSMRGSDVLYAFKQYTEFSDHMRHHHHIHDASKYLTASTKPPQTVVSESQRRVREGDSAGSSELLYMDLDVGTASPLPNAATPSSTGAASVPSRPPASMRYRNSILSNIPSNMTIAGRVTGSGRFASMGSGEMEAMQTLLDDHAVRNHEQVFPALSGDKADHHFPGLAEELTSEKQSIHTVHPMSLLNKKPAPTAQKTAESEATSSSAPTRHQALAEAFGIANVPTAPHIHVHKMQQIVESLAYLNLSEYYLSSYLYPWEVVNWAKKNRSELLKIESKVVGFLNSEGQNSVQLKPMEYSVRGIVHLYAKYCRMNSYEYDPEPRRYVSLVRRLDSCVPRLLLSSAALLPLDVIFPDDPASLAGKEDVTMLYFVLRGGISSLWTSASDGGKNKTVAATNTFHANMVMVGEVIDTVKQLLAVIREDYASAFCGETTYDPSHNNSFYNSVAALHLEIVNNNINMAIDVDYVEQSGPHVIGIGMHNRYAAALAMLYMGEAEYWEYHGHQVAVELFRYYKVQASFHMPQLDLSMLQYVTVDAKAPTDVDPDATAYAPNEPAVPVDDSNFASSDDYVVVEPHMSEDVPPARAVANNWEDASDSEHALTLHPQESKVVRRSKVDDDWDSFLAEKRAVASSALYVPKRTLEAEAPTERMARYVPKKADFLVAPASTRTDSAPSAQSELATEDIPSEFLAEHLEASRVLGVGDESWQVAANISSKTSKPAPLKAAGAGSIGGSSKDKAAAPKPANRFCGFDSDED